jgi:hypothetical protein
MPVELDVAVELALVEPDVAVVVVLIVEPVVETDVLVEVVWPPAPPEPVELVEPPFEQADKAIGSAKALRSGFRMGRAV